MPEIDDSLEPLCEIVPDSKTVMTLCRDIEIGLYEGAPHQRPCRWPMRLFELLIITITRQLPMAPIHMCEHARGPNSRGGARPLEVNDGGHRLRGIFAYRNNEFAMPIRDPKTEKFANVYYSWTPLTPGPRKPFNDREKIHILMENGAKCAGCEAPASLSFEFDHVVPLWKGGEHTVENAQTLCTACHAAKTANESGERARCSVGTASDRAMTDAERHRFDNYSVQIVTYKNYTCSAPEVHRLIFRQVQNGVTMNTNDRIFAQSSNAFLQFVEKSLVDIAKTRWVQMLCATVNRVSMEPQDFWNIRKSECNIYQVAEGLFRGVLKSHGAGEQYVPGSCSLRGGAVDPACHDEVTRDSHLRPFARLVVDTCTVINAAAPGRIVRYEDFAIVMHACNSGSDFFSRATAVANRLSLASLIDIWAETKSMRPHDVQEKLRQLKSAVDTACDNNEREQQAAKRPCVQNSK
mgnify:CR=1 FL=1|uniref:HNH nuclease domain-containing protein n=1 Tax=viral metagenome TaxID=1070528 RepID=A0A6C0KCS0_9ZZZZ